jgi:prephenate dehydratase
VSTPGCTRSPWSTARASWTCPPRSSRQSTRRSPPASTAESVRRRAAAASPSGPIRVSYLGPAGTFSEEAVVAASQGLDIEPLPKPTIYDAILAVERGEADRALVPYENAIEGSVRATLDTLAFEAERVGIVGEYDLPIRHSLVARRELPLGEIAVVLSHPQASAQCARFLREQLEGAEVRGASSTAEAVRLVSEADGAWGAVGTEAAAALYGCVVLREGIEDVAENVTRFVWIAGEGSEPIGDGPWKTSLVFAELGEDHPGALAEALQEFADRGLNLTRIESRPLRRGLGRYMFFCDVEGAASDPTVGEAIAALRSKAESVRVLGSYPSGSFQPG